ncbi:MAG: hypothetical protein HKM93_24045, partial [Desulfobacteraceae bacterium]|nr:hypothetical protein [Desulfobacteraceae bacterium]
TAAASTTCPPDKTDYLAYPSFLTSRVEPNVLLILDNSGSMNEFAYHEVEGNRDGNDAWTGYDPAKEYYGLFNPNKCYNYDTAHHYFYVNGDTKDDPATPDIIERSAGFDADPRRFSGNWLNWWTMRRIDVAKKVLTGGRVAPDDANVVLEGMPMERDRRRIFNDYTTATDPHDILTGVHAKNVYYTPFRRGIYSWWFNVDRHDHLGETSENTYFVPMFNAVAADFNSQDDLIGDGTVRTQFKDPTAGDIVRNYYILSEDSADSGTDNIGEPKNTHDYAGYVVAVKVETAELPVQGIIQQMTDRVRFGYMQFNLGRGPGDGEDYTRNKVYGNWDIDDDGHTDITWRYADGGRVRNFVGDESTTTDPNGDTVLQIIQNINQQNIQMMTPIEEVLWEALRYYQQVSPEFKPEDSPDTPPANKVDFEVSDTWDPYYFNDLNGPGSGGFVPCAKSYIILVSDGEGNNNSGVPGKDWPSGANNSFAWDGDGYLDDIAFSMHTTDLRVSNTWDPDKIKQSISLYTIFTFDDSEEARNEMMRAARAGGFNDLDGDGKVAGKAMDEKPWTFEGDPEWDQDGDNIPDTYFEAQDGAQMEQQLMAAIADILSKTASGTAASVISNARGGKGAVYQAVFFTESAAEPLTAKTVKWHGNVHTLLIDDYGYMHEDTNQNQTLDVSDRIVVYDGETGKADLHSFDPSTGDRPGSGNHVVQLDITDLKFLWDANKWLSDTALDPASQRVYKATTKQRHIFTEEISTASFVSLDNVDSTEQMDFLPAFVNDATNDNYFFMNPHETGYSEADMIAEAQNIINYTRGVEGLIKTGTTAPYRNRSLDLDGDGSKETIYRLGDIINSTPTVVSQPAEDFDLLYKDDSYREFRKANLDRRTVIYAGANDGMFHAFNGGFFHPKAQKFSEQPLKYDEATASYVVDGAAGKTAYGLGSELWAYVPNAVLPHLKWLTEPLSLSTHYYFVDLKPRIFDARIFADDDDHKNGWGTILIGGMRFGGAPIGVDTSTPQDGTCDLEFTSTYFAIDITNPEKEPDLLWSFTHADLGFTTNYPTAITVGEKWYVVIGSGPTHFDAYKATAAGAIDTYGGSNQQAKVFILNADDGTLATTNPIVMDTDAFMSDPIAVDFDLKAWDDPSSGKRLWTGEAIYIGSDGAGTEKGRVFRIVTNENPDPKSWVKSVLFNPNSAGDNQHINTALTVSQDDSGRFWVYFGTGRFWGTNDRKSPYFEYQNSFYGIKEPVNSDGDFTWATVGDKGTNLVNVSLVSVSDTGGVSGSTVSAADFEELVAEVETKSGWYLDFDIEGERNLGQAAVLGDIVTFTTYLPENDLCATEGSSFIYGLHYKTGTAYEEGVLLTSDNNYTGVDASHKVIKKIEIGKGYSITPNIHTGRKEGSTAFIQTSSGAIVDIEQVNPGVTKSGKVSWRDMD